MTEETLGDLLSCIVYAQPGRGSEAAAAIERRPGAEVLAGAAESKLVVTLEDTAESRAADVLAELNTLPGVINTVLIYHCAGSVFAESPRRAGPGATEH